MVQGCFRDEGIAFDREFRLLGAEFGDQTLKSFELCSGSGMPKTLVLGDL